MGRFFVLGGAFLGAAGFFHLVILKLLAALLLVIPDIFFHFAGIVHVLLIFQRFVDFLKLFQVFLYLFKFLVQLFLLFGKFLRAFFLILTLFRKLFLLFRRVFQVLDHLLQHVQRDDVLQHHGPVVLGQEVRHALVVEGETNHRAHTIALLGSSWVARYVEFRDLGPRGKLGLYPMHIHNWEDATPALIEGNAIHQTVSEYGNRWITLHNIRYANVINNVGYRAHGHGFFMEDGVERDNYVVGNHSQAVTSARTETTTPLRMSMPTD
jgi:hypothetical protein